MNKIAFLLMLGFGVFSCGTKNSVTKTNETQNTTETTEIALPPIALEGKMLYQNNCTNCHKSYNPTDFSKEEWKPILLRMQKNAKISDADREKIYVYLSQ